MTITINGNRREVAEDTALLALLDSLHLNPKATVVERNGAVVDRCEYGAMVLAEGDVLELVRFVGGG